MKLFFAFCLCLLTWTQVAPLTVHVDSVYDIGYFVSAFQLMDGNRSILVNATIDDGAPGDIYLDIIFATGENYYEYRNMTGKLCDEDASTDEGLTAAIVRKSLGFTCPVEAGEYYGLDDFVIRGSLSGMEPYRIHILSVDGYIIRDDDPDEKEIVFTANYEIREGEGPEP